MKIKELLLQSGAQVAFALTTPVPIAGRRNKRVVNYNKEARRYERKPGHIFLHCSSVQTLLLLKLFSQHFYFMEVSEGKKKQQSFGYK